MQIEYREVWHDTPWDQQHLKIYGWQNIFRFPYSDIYSDVFLIFYLHWLYSISPGQEISSDHILSQLFFFSDSNCLSVIVIRMIPIETDVTCMPCFFRWIWHDGYLWAACFCLAGLFELTCKTLLDEGAQANVAADARRLEIARVPCWHADLAQDGRWKRRIKSVTNSQTWV